MIKIIFQKNKDPNTRITDDLQGFINDINYFTDAYPEQVIRQAFKAGCENMTAEIRGRDSVCISFEFTKK